MLERTKWCGVLLSMCMWADIIQYLFFLANIGLFLISISDHDNPNPTIVL